jgi:RIO-like serine/threonine protein kinase
MSSQNIDDPDTLPVEKVLKQDLFGRVEQVRLRGASEGDLAIRRDTTCSRWWTRPLARWLAAREARALAAASQVPDVPRLLCWESGILLRSWLPGEPMQVARPRDSSYFVLAFKLLRRLHRAGIVHNDLAKEANWLVRENGTPALIDFQLAWAPRRRTRLFRTLGREDLRHLLKHKRYYCPDHLTDRERKILAQPAWLSRLWMSSGKPVYVFITRRIFRWQDREGANDRDFG